MRKHDCKNVLDVIPNRFLKIFANSLFLGSFVFFPRKMVLFDFDLSSEKRK